MSSAATADVAVCIGRFQVFHNAQLALVRQALALAPRCVVVLGSAHQARTPRNPFSWQERVELISLALSPDERARLQFLPVRDHYDTERWVRSVREGVAALVSLPRPQVVLVGHRKDATGYYLDHFPGWALHDAGPQGDIHAHALRDAWFGADGHSLAAALAALVGQVPPSTIDFLRAWTALPHYARLAQEWRALRADKAAWASAPYPPVFVTVDAVIRCAGRVLLIQRGRAPGKGLWALPGGFLEQRESVYQSAVRELEEETGLRLLPGDMAHALRAVQVFDHPDRSQRGRVITHAHFFELGDRPLPEVQGSDDAADARWFTEAEILGMEEQFHDDHFHILDAMLGLRPA